jgi:hypothetical protein
MSYRGDSETHWTRKNICSIAIFVVIAIQSCGIQSKSWVIQVWKILILLLLKIIFKLHWFKHEMVKLFIDPTLGRIMTHRQVYNEPAKQVWQKVYGNMTQTRILEKIMLITTYFHNTMTNTPYRVTWSWSSVCKFTDHETISEHIWVKWKVPISLSIEELLAGVINVMGNSDTSSYVIYWKWILWYILKCSENGV